MIIDIRYFSGLPLEVNTATNNIIFLGELKKPDLKLVTVDEILPYLLDKKVNYPTIINFIYKNVHLKEHEKVFIKNRLVHSIMLIPLIGCGVEKNKTKLYCYPKVKDTHITHPAIIQVLYGTAIVYLEKENDTFFISGKQNEKIIIPPNTSYSIINDSESEPLVFSIISTEPKETLKEPRFFFTRQGVARNKKIDTKKELKEIKNEIKIFNIIEGPLYTGFCEFTEHYDFLINPKKYVLEFEKYLR